jgi:hypothetical protein
MPSPIPDLGPEPDLGAALFLPRGRNSGARGLAQKLHLRDRNVVQLGRPLLGPPGALLATFPRDVGARKCPAHGEIPRGGNGPSALHEVRETLPWGGPARGNIAGPRPRRVLLLLLLLVRRGQRAPASRGRERANARTTAAAMRRGDPQTQRRATDGSAEMPFSGAYD